MSTDDDVRHAGSSDRYWLSYRQPGRGGRWGSGSDAKDPAFTIHVVTAENRALYRAEMEANFRLRHQVLVEERGWIAFRSPDGRQVDQYDTDETVYLLVIEPEKQTVVGSCRLIATTGGPLLQDYKELKGDFPIPRSTDVLHLSRFIVAPQWSEAVAPHALACTILAGVQEYCLPEDIAQVVALSRVCWLPMLLDLGWNPQPLGLPVTHWNESVLVSTWDVSEVAYRRTCAVLGIHRTLLVRRGITRRPGSPLRDPGRYS